MDSEWALFKSSIAEMAAASCGWNVVDVCCGGKPKNTLVDISGEGGHQAEEGGLSGLVDLWVSQFCRQVLAG